MLEDKLLIWKFNRGDRGALRGVYEKYKDDLVTLAAALLMRWKVSDGQYRVVFGDLLTSDVTPEELAQLEKQ